jgi:hypothetical protein
VKYKNGVYMSYHLTAYSPWEGFRIVFNGTEGRLEYEVLENSYVSGGVKDMNSPLVNENLEVQEEKVTITLQKHWEKVQSVDLPEVNTKGHGGGDERLMEDLFSEEQKDDPYMRKADHIAGIRAALTGICANRSIATGQAIHCKEVMNV